MNKRNMKVVMVGPFPPPTYGLASVNQAVFDRLSNAGMVPRRIDTAGIGLSRKMFVRIRRINRVFAGIIALVKAPRVSQGTLYISISGGLGQIYEIIFILIARLTRYRIVLHHHSFAYLSRRKFVTTLLVSTAGTNALHILLSDGMRNKFNSIYKVKATTMAMSNAILLFENSPLSRKNLDKGCACRVGFLSNISLEKGILEFLDFMTVARNIGMEIEGKLAGPFEDEPTKRQVLARLKELGNVSYLGAVYGKDKTKFFGDIDVLLFPTKYRNEAEPLVVLEALQAAVPVIAYGRGAISECINDECGRLVAPEADFTREALQAVRNWQNDSATFHNVRLMARARYDDIRRKGAKSWETLFDLLVCG